MARRKQPNPGDSEDDALLFELPEQSNPGIEVKTTKRPIWTENKARLIERYLYYFVMITKHGVYIDGFAGPQNPGDPDMWAARLVLQSEPRWFRDFYLCDIEPGQLARLDQLVEEQPPRDRSKREPARNIKVGKGDFNVLVHEMLDSGFVPENQATFCLLDQRTFECKWSTLEALAAYKPDEKNKIELFYFLPSGWLGRSIAGTTTNRHVIDEWWGGSDWDTKLVGVNRQGQAEIFKERFIRELGYNYVVYYPIYERPDQGGGNIMYYMIHATDHSEAPKLMRRAYERAVGPKERMEDLLLEFDFVKPRGESER